VRRGRSWPVATDPALGAVQNGHNVVMTRSARLAAGSDPRLVSATGSRCSWNGEPDGTVQVTFDGVLLVDGVEVHSPHQLLRLWEDQAFMQMEIGDATLAPTDTAPPDLMAQMAAYGVAAQTIRAGRAKGILPDDQVPEALEFMQRQVAEQGPQAATKVNHFEAMEFGVRLFGEMAAAWRRALTVQWLDDPDDGTSIRV